MPICKKCNNPFPNNIKINNKIHNLQRRSNCLVCVPFGERFRKDRDVKFETLICSICGRKYEYHHSTTHSRSKCNSCIVNTQRFKKRDMALEYLGSKCQVCGYNKCSRALHFHHKDPSTKLFGISGSHCYSWEKIKSELDKCVLLCSNCHMELEDRLITI